MVKIKNLILYLKDSNYISKTIISYFTLLIVCVHVKKRLRPICIRFHSSWTPTYYKGSKKRVHVIIGLLTDKAIAESKRVPLLSYDQRKIIIENIKGVDEVVPQGTWDYKPNLIKIKPDYVIHGDDWKEGVQKQMREKVLSLLKTWGEKLIELPYTRDISSSQISRIIQEAGTTPHARRRRLRQLLEAKPIVRILEAHNGLTGAHCRKNKIYNK